jgi:toxin FitB
MYLVDTNVLSEARRGSKEARIWLRSIDPTTIYLSVITLGEIMKGIAFKLRADARAAAALTAWLEQLRRDHSDRILPISDPIALEWGRLAAERSQGMADGLIAATAVVHSKIIVTHNAEGFSGVGIPVIDPWNQ